ncbi:MAG TPA: BlaI/MecI/CopY family transcriptional regulator [Parafilimonas sp.]
MKENKTSAADKIEPTKAELEILQVLWKYGPSNVRLVNNKLNESTRTVQYTSTLKLMQIMHAKGMLKRNDTSMTHIYSPAEPENKTKNFLLDRFINSMFNGSPSGLVLQLLGNKKTSKKELKLIKDLLKDIDKDL